MKYFIITVDTEGDNLWDYSSGKTITTNNSAYIPRFQELCDDFRFPPVYLTNYEMLMDDNYVNYVKEWSSINKCEVGIHLHAWNNPPLFELPDIYHGNPYLIEYPKNVMREKFDVLYNLFIQKLDTKPKSHRAGRWAMDSQYFSLLSSYGILIDCSITPGIDWTTSKGRTINGPNYSNYPTWPYFDSGVYEVPVPIMRIHHSKYGSLRHRIRTLVLGDRVWLRPATQTTEMMKKFLVSHYKTKSDYVEFMIHSSELMPGGSPYFKDNNSIEKLYSKMNEVFSYAQQLGYVGITLYDYYKIKNGCY